MDGVGNSEVDVTLLSGLKLSSPELLFPGPLCLFWRLPALPLLPSTGPTC